MENQKRVIALGFFDGIHIGHAALMRRTVARAGVKRGLIKRRGRTGDSASSASQNKLALTNC